jgi:hypothetical protein
MIAAVLAALTGVAGPTGLRADEVSVQNDSASDFGAVNICPCFAPNEEAAAWLTAPCDGTIVAVQILWVSESGGSLQSLEDAITVYEAGSFPNPGPIILNGDGQPAELVGPVMTDGGLNEFRFLDEFNTQPLSIPVTAGQQFVVSLRFFNDNQCNPLLGEDCSGVPSVASDCETPPLCFGSCQAGKNAVKVNGIQWTDACSLGVSGDWIIRAVVDCPPEPPGACCLPDGSCVVQDELPCDFDGGVFLGSGTACDGTCPQPGACCLPDGTCAASSVVGGEDCTAVGGEYLGDGTACDGTECPDPVGACCLGGGCDVLTDADCAAAGGSWLGVGSDCGDCTADGACCFADGTCVDLAPAVCADFAGSFQGLGTDCASAACSLGACCSSTGSCALLEQETCESIPGASWAGPLTSCDDGNQNGQPDGCEPSCPSDIDGSGVVDVDDLVTVILDWGQADSPADVDGSGTVDVDDLVLVILAWGPCS